jgi:hypothetical protein
MNEIEEARQVVDSWYLGQTSSHFESSGQGAGVISTGKGDHGGASYGTYQLSTKMGTLREYLSQSRFGEKFLALTPNTPAFNAKWKEVARTDPGFAKDQHDFIGKSHYGEQLVCLHAAGIELSNRGRAVQDAIWSTSVQFRGLTTRIFARGLAEKFGENFDLARLSDKDVVEAVQDYKIAHNASLFRSSPTWQPGLLRRASTEKSNLLRLATQEATLEANGVDIARLTIDSAPKVPAHGQDDVLGDVLHLGDSHKDRIRTMQASLIRLGYRDPHGHPLTIDGTPGPNTEHAIKSFQHAHRLHVDGVAGKDTLAALVDARHSPLLSEATHPAHPLYTQVLHGIRTLPHGTFGSEDEQRNLAVALTIAAHVSGLKKIDHVVLGMNGVNVFAVQGRLDDPAHLRTHVDRVQSMTHTVDHNSLGLQQAMHAHPVHAHIQAPPDVGHRATGMEINR